MSYIALARNQEKSLIRKVFGTAGAGALVGAGLAYAYLPEYHAAIRLAAGAVSGAVAGLATGITWTTYTIKEEVRD